MKKKPYSSPEDTCIEIMSGDILAASEEPNTVSHLGLYEMDEE